jgi:hypothetical protein
MFHVQQYSAAREITTTVSCRVTYEADRLAIIIIKILYLSINNNIYNMLKECHRITDSKTYARVACKYLGENINI